MIAPAEEQLGSIVRSMREGDTVVFEIDGVRIGTVSVLDIPHEAKARIVFTFVRKVRISHKKFKPPAV